MSHPADPPPPADAAGPLPLPTLMFQHDDDTCTAGLIHFAFEGESMPDYLRQIDRTAVPLCQVHLSALAPLRVERVDPPLGLTINEVRVEEGESSTAGAALRLLCSGRRPSAPLPPAAAAVSQLDDRGGAAGEAPSQLYEEFHARNESIRSLLFDVDDAPTGPSAESMQPTLADRPAAPAEWPGAVNGGDLPPLSHSQLQQMGQVAAHTHSNNEQTGTAIPRPPPPLDDLPAIRKIVSDPTVLPPMLALETPMVVNHTPSASADDATSQSVTSSISVAPIVLPTVASAVAGATSAASGSAAVQSLVLPTPTEWSPPDAAATCTPLDLQNHTEMQSQPKARSEEKEQDDSLPCAAATASLASALSRFLTPPLPSTAPIKRALTASAASSPLRTSMPNGVAQRASPLFKPYQQQHPSIALSRRGSASSGGGGRPSALVAPHESDSLRRGSFPPPPPLGMLRQHSQLNLQQAAAAGISPFRSHARSFAALHGHGHSLSATSISNPSSAAPSPSGHRDRRCCPPAHPFVDNVGGALLLADGGAALSSDMVAALSLLKTQLDEVVERRVREVRREMEEMAAAQFQQCALAMQTAAAAAAASSAAASASHTGAVSADGLHHVTPFQVPSSALLAVGEQPSGAHPFVQETPTRFASPMPPLAAAVPSPRPSPPSAAASAGGAIARQATPIPSAPQSRNVAAALTALLTSPRGVGSSALLGPPTSTRSHPSLSRQSSPRPFAFAVAAPAPAAPAPSSTTHATTLLSPRAHPAFVFPHAAHPSLGHAHST